MTWINKVCTPVLLLGIFIAQSTQAITFSSTTYEIIEGTGTIISEDFNNDGAADIATASSSISVFLNDNDLTGSFGSYNNSGGSNTLRSLASADFNGDGAADLVATSQYDNTIRVLLNNNNTTGTFNAATTYPAGDGPYSVISGDFNDDGAPDLAVTNSTSGYISIFLNTNNLSGTFSAKVDYPAGILPLHITSGDFNSDGAADLAIVNTGSDTVSILINKNDSSGTFNAAANYSTDSSAVSIVSADFNGDGAADIAVGNSALHTVSIFLNKNDSSGTFDLSVDFAVGGGAGSLISADFNGDGAFDIASLNSSSDTVSLLLNKNNSTGAFYTGIVYDAGVAPASITSGDFNSDGDIDIALSNSGSTITVLLNTPGTPPDVFAFVAQSNVARNTWLTSEVITVTGLDRSTAITVTGGEYSINNAAFTSVEGTILNNDLLQVRVMSSSAYNAAANTKVVIGGVGGTFIVTTLTGQDPDSFTFIDQTEVEFDTLIKSNPVTITGLAGFSPIRIGMGQYSINSGAFTSADGFVNNNDTVIVRHISSMSSSTVVNSTLTIGTVSDTFSSTTKSFHIADSPSGGGSTSLFCIIGFLPVLLCRYMRTAVRF